MPDFDRSRLTELLAVEQAAYTKGHPRSRTQHAHDCARQGEQDALGHQLFDETAAAGADRCPQGHFTLAHGRAREQEVRHVDARDEQQHT